MLHALRPASYLVALCTLSMVSPSAAAQGSSFQGRVEVLRGRAVLFDEDGSRRLLGTLEEFRLPEQAHLELGAGAELRLSWPGLASMNLWGPASLDWQPWEPRAATPEREPGLAWRVSELAWADLEVRKGVHRLELPGDWSARLEKSAVHLRSLPWGPIEVRHHAGRVIQMLWSGDPQHVRPPLTIYPGSSLRLDQPPEGADDVSRHARAWDLPTWPWSRRTDNAEQADDRRRLAELTDRQRRGPEAWPAAEGARERASEFQDRRNLYTEVLSDDPEEDPQAAGAYDPIEALEEAPAKPWQPTELSEERPSPSNAVPVRPETQPSADTDSSDAPTKSSISSQARRRTTLERLPRQEPRPQGRASTTEAPAQQVLPPRPRVSKARGADLDYPEDSPRWRGVKASQRVRAGQTWVQNSRGVEVRASSGERWKVLVDRTAPSGIWCFTPETDYFLKPGSVAVFDADGRMRTSYGMIDSHAQPTSKQ